jgi:hypothetical protein
MATIAELMAGLGRTFGGTPTPQPTPTPDPNAADPWNNPALNAPAAPAAAPTPSPSPYTYQTPDPFAQAQQLEQRNNAAAQLAKPGTQTVEIPLDILQAILVKLGIK